MSDLKQQITADLTTAMKARDKVTSSTLRMVRTAIQNAEVAGSEAKELTDEEVLAVITKEGKKRRDAIAEYEKAGRPELAESEKAELEVIEGYLPKQLSDEELEALVAEAVAEAGVTETSQMGQAMKAAQAKVAGRAEGGRVAAAVKKHLG
ncbi:MULTISPECIES: GatB/YqeY domain-containing protein [Kytococcus]|uniref:GatB/YqeY domain-containing protein n=1 Tax=Kytococcus schroeteri TaxID=138300 RepID=A0A2I1PC70_9MICO|nr:MULTISPECIES: GatB/YqeY domain-containing protein [Kytococcus]OFS13012.1 glutamyl-tRNA amidotransferase [Kytococcus sp. HMSC28H12]PKZ42210.1 GatB/YqeY domain-containing protein [Kytococcus schroeteri]